MLAGDTFASAAAEGRVMGRSPGFNLIAFALASIAFWSGVEVAPAPALGGVLLGVEFSGNARHFDSTTGMSSVLGPTGFVHLNALARDHNFNFFAAGTVGFAGG